MADPAANTAEAQLDRVLYILAAARAGEGIPVAELAATLGVAPATIQGDVAQVTSREFYHPAASAMDLTLLLDGDRISVPLPGAYFDRPMRLTPHEAGALGLALRARAAEATSPYREQLLELAVELERALTAPAPRTQSPGANAGSVRPAGAAPAAPDGPSLATAIEIDPGEGVESGLRLLLEQASAAHAPVRIRYLKPADAAPTERVIHPYALVTFEGEWYVLAFSPERAGMREFRLDRVLSAQPLEGAFEVSPDFDAAAYTERGLPFRSGDEAEAVVRYSPRVAPWILERGKAERRPDGSVLLRHRVADAGWLVREILRFGGEAEVLAPEEMRQRVAEAAERIGSAYREEGPTSPEA